MIIIIARGHRGRRRPPLRVQDEQRGREVGQRLMNVYAYTVMYIYIERERKIDRCIHTICICIYIYICKTKELANILCGNKTKKLER